MGAKRKAFLLLGALALLAFVISGCGSDEKELSPRAANEALITEKDLPSNNVRTEESSPTEPCGPMPIFKENGAKTGITSLFAMGPLVLQDRQMRLKEAVGAFEDEGDAETAYEELTDPKRYECIAKTASEASTVEDKVSTSQPQSFGLGEEDEFVRFREVDAQSPLPYALDVMTIRNGRCVAALVFIPREQQPSDATARKVGKVAAARLAAVCE